MESRAKQRLTGAIIVVALFVLLVPELLTGPRDAHPPETAADDGLRRYTIDLDARDAGGQSATSAGPEAPVNLPPVMSPEPAPSVTTNPGATSNGVTTPPESADTPAASPAGSAPAPAVRAAPAEGSAGNAVAQTAPPRPTAAAANGKYVVQLGSFGSRDNAERLVRDMTAKGFSAFIAPITTNGRELYRVRVGPTRDRASAEALAAQLKRVGQSGSIVPLT
ncbi:MAG TPA: SPOR domain-containing protein [Steroidobacteraceae bacterium]|jgi:DedD protein|nr:SPOR domain-containing protein [Steroidobacteraceae bacterium]